MSAEQQSLPAAAELVTATITNPATGKAWTFHGRMGAERYTALTVGDTSSEWGVHHHPHRGTTAARAWVVVEHTIAHPQYTHQIPYRGWDWECRLFALHVCIDPASTVTITPITDEGREWLRAHESVEEKRDRLLARFADLDPTAAAELEDVIAELVADARERASDEAYVHFDEQTYDER